MFLPVMTGKNIFVCKFFLSLTISDFSRKIHPLFPSNAPLKTKILWSPPLFEDLVGRSVSMNFILT